MGTFGFPSDSFAQSQVHIQREPAPPAPTAPERAAGPSASSLPAPHDKAVAWEAPAVTALPMRDTT